MSTRAIAPVVGASQRTVADDASEQKCSVAEVVSLDGRRRPAQGKAKPKHRGSEQTKVWRVAYGHLPSVPTAAGCR